MSGGHHQSHERQGSRLGPCGACKYLRRKCIKGCVFAPYFNSDEGGAAHFAAVHRVFGASNAAKLLLRIPSHRRRDAVLTLSYEALSRVHDPVYGCVSHILSLHQQSVNWRHINVQRKVMNMQAELALIQATLSTIQRPSPSSVTFPITLDEGHLNCCFDQMSSSSITTTTTTTTTVTSMPLFDHGFHTQQTPSPGAELASFCNKLTDYNNADEHMINDIIDNADLQNFTGEFVSKYLPGIEFKSDPQ